jgi:NAD(P)-dependent dehydrogenase (short-subunit alcohol dehydrogenase family)
LFFSSAKRASATVQFEGQSGQVACASTKGTLVSMTLPMTRDLERYGIRVVTTVPEAFTAAWFGRGND